MSQSGNYFAGTPAGGAVNTLTGNAGGAIGPDGAANINIVGGVNTTVTGNAATNTLTIGQSGGMEGTGQTIGAVNGDLITFPLGAVAGTYTMSVRVAAFEATTPAGAGYRINSAVRTTGGAATLIGVNATDTFEEAALNTCSVAIVVVGNSAIVRVMGAAGLTIDWDGELDSIFAP